MSFKDFVIFVYGEFHFLVRFHISFLFVDLMLDQARLGRSLFSPGKSRLDIL